MTARARVATLAGVLLLVAVTSACSSPEPIPAEHAVFDGLSREAVVETLDLMSDELDQVPEESRLAFAQDSVVELETCRAVLDRVESWTGPEAPPEPLVLAAPTSEAFAAATAEGEEDRPDFGGHSRELVLGHVATGDRDGLVEFLTMEVGCAWMPVEPGVDGPSINEHARATYGPPA
ncbi:hypothetical protein [Oerskovia jenensis]|uniref:hypothetical protein n=1 Tax=Oerskovia jenensis TaxID=162169 RepID=UPI0036DDBFCF